MVVNPCWDAGCRNDWKECGCGWWFGLLAIVYAYSDGIGESSLTECMDVKIVKILYAKLYYYNIY